MGADGPTSGVPIAWRGSGGAIGNGVQPPCTRPAGGPTIRWCRCRGSVCDRCRFTSVTERPRRPDRYAPALTVRHVMGSGTPTPPRDLFLQPFGCISFSARIHHFQVGQAFYKFSPYPLAASPVDIHRQALLISGSCKHAVAAGRGSYRLPVGAPGSDLSVTVTGFGLISTTSEEYQCSFAEVTRTGTVC